MILDTLETTGPDVVEATERSGVSRLRVPVVDCDVHPTVKSIDELKPFLSNRWWEHLQNYGMRPRHGFAQGDPYPKAAPRAARRDAWTTEGFQPGSDLEFMRTHYLDAYDIEHAILSPLYPTGQGDQNVEFSAAMCAAANDWQLAKWTTQDRRCKASILVPSEDAALAVAEIERCAANKDFVQVLMLTRAIEPFGKRRFWPIYEAAEQHGLPVAIHVFGYSGHPVGGAGWPSYYCEEMTGHSGACQSVVTSLVMEGVFERYPGLKVVKIEGGFGWLPSLTWRLDKHWSRLRAEVPHLRRPPSEYLKEHLWLTTQPMEEPEKSEQLLDLMRWIGFDRILFATDYPHWDFDDPMQALPRRLDLATRRQLCSGNAKRLYQRLD